MNKEAMKFEQMRELADETMQEAPEGVEAEMAAAADDAQADTLCEDIRGLFHDGWSAEMLEAFAGDEQARLDVQRGLSIRQAATAYLLRRIEQLEKPQRRHGVPNLRARATSGERMPNRVEQMSAKEFAQFSAEAYARAMAGEKVAL